MLRFIPSPFAILLFLILVHIILLFQTVFWPAIEWRVFPYLTSVGLIPYKEIIDQHFPGLFFFPINLYSLGLATPIGIRAIQILLVLTTHIIIYLTTNKITNNARLSLVSNILYLPIHVLYEGYVLWIDSVIPPLLAFSCYFLVDKLTAKRLLTSGLLIGIALFFKQLVFLAFIPIFLWVIVTSKSVKATALFLTGFLLPTLYLLISILPNNTWDNFFYWTFTFNKTVYASEAFRTPSAKEVFFYSLIIIPTLLSLLYNIYFLKNRIAALLACFTLPLLVFIYGRYDFVHLQPFLPFASISITLSLLTLKSKLRLIIGTVFILSIFAITLLHVSKLGKYDTFIDTTHQEIIHKVSELKNHNAQIYIHNGNHEIYQLTHTVPATKLYVPLLPFYTSIMEQKILQQMKNTKPDYIISKHLELQQSIDRYISRHYSPIDEANEHIIFKRN